MAYHAIALAEVKPGMNVTVWYNDGNRGQGGTVTSCGSKGLSLQGPDGQGHSFNASSIHQITYEAPLPAEECLEWQSGRCQGPVEPHTVGDSLKAWPRCDYHYEQRCQNYENSMERYANQVNPPAWFDPSYAGESWDAD
jgi:hypothetical protein